MITRKELVERQWHSFELFREAGVFVTAAEKDQIEIADFNLNRFEEIGLGVLVYVNTARCCAKELAMWPGQTCPQHLHPPVGDDPGKEETFRCRWGKLWLYLSGAATNSPRCKPPIGRESTYTVFHEIELGPGDQYTIAPGTWHWFQAGPEGAVVSEFSTRSTDENDLFTDQEIQRITTIA